MTAAVLGRSGIAAVAKLFVLFLALLGVTPGCNAAVLTNSGPGSADSGIGSSPAGPEITVTRGKQGEVRLNYCFKPGQTNWVSASDNLVNWLPVAVGVTDTNGLFRFEDDASGQRVQRFYRIAAEPDATVRTMRNLRFGLFVCWSNSSFTGRTAEGDGVLADWPLPYATPDQSGVTFFNPSGLENADVGTLQKNVTDKWVDLAVSAGMSHLLVCVKHIDGLCLWASAASPTNCITCASRKEARVLHSDLVKAVANSCAAQGLRLGFYYCLADRQLGWNSAATNASVMVKRHLSELLSGSYGPIDYLFLDLGYGGQDLNPVGKLKYWVTKTQRQDLIDFVHGSGLDRNGSGLSRLGRTNTFVSFNDPDLSMPGDYAVLENGHPHANVPKFAEFSFPIMSGPSGRRWFYSIPSEENRCMSVEDLRDYYDRSLDERNVFDLSVGPDRSGQIRAIDVQTIQALTQALAGDSSIQPNHFLINDTGTRVNGRVNGSITYSSGGGWRYQSSRGLGDYGDDAHITSLAGDSCQFQFTGTAVEFLTAESSHFGSVDIYLDDELQTGAGGLDLHPQSFRPGHIAFAMAGLPLGPHTLKIVTRRDRADVAVDAFRVYNGVLQNLSVDADGFVWAADSEHQVWTYGPWLTNSVSLWVRIPGTARDIGCGNSIWKIGTAVPRPTDFPRDYTISRWAGFEWEWLTMVFGEGTGVDVAADETVWTINDAGQVGRYTNLFDPLSWLPAGPENFATDIGCQSAGDPAVCKIGTDAQLASWTGSGWEMPISGAGVRTDVASNGDVWLVNAAGELWQSHSSHWSRQAAMAVAVGCGAHGEVWYISTDGTLHRVLDH